MPAKGGQLDRLPGLQHPLLSRPLHPDPGPPVLHEVGAHARLEVVARRDLAAVRLDKAGVDGQVLGLAGAFPRNPTQQPAVGLEKKKKLDGTIYIKTSI